jgi:hypothetical protein
LPLRERTDELTRFVVIVGMDGRPRAPRRFAEHRRHGGRRADDRRRVPTGRESRRSGTRTRSSTRSTFARSMIAIATASPTSAGLTEKLEYLEDLGVTAIWLLPFYPSPLRMTATTSRTTRRPSRVRHATGLHRVPARSAPPRPARHHRACSEPHLRPAPVVPAGAASPARHSRAELLRVEQPTGALQGSADHLRRFRAVELGVGSARRPVLLIASDVLLAQLLRDPTSQRKHFLSPHIRVAWDDDAWPLVWQENSEGAGAAESAAWLVELSSSV